MRGSTRKCKSRLWDIYLEGKKVSCTPRRLPQQDKEKGMFNGGVGKNEETLFTEEVRRTNVLRDVFFIRDPSLTEVRDLADNW